MKKLFPDAPDVPQGTANRGVRIIERHLRMHKVDRAKDLPEEAKVRLLRDLRDFYDSEAQTRGGQGPGAERRSLWERFWAKIEDLLSFSSLETPEGLALCAVGGSEICLMVARRS